MVNRFVGNKTRRSDAAGFLSLRRSNCLFITPQKKYELNDTLEVKAMNIDIPQQTVVFVPL